MNKYNRRRFLKLGSQTMIGAGLALGGNPLKSLAYADDTSQTQGNGYRALVCIYLEGGIDGFSLMAPSGSYENQIFAEARGNLAIDRSQLIELGGGTSPLALHNTAASLQSLYDEGRLATIANVGTLIEPTTVEQYQNNAVCLLYTSPSPRDRQKSRMPSSA